MLARIDEVLRPRGRVFYGWWIVLAAFGMQFLPGLLMMQSFGAYVVLLQKEFAWSATAIGGAFALTRIESGLLGPLQGWMVDRFGPKPILRIGILMFGMGFLLFSQINSLLAFYVVFAVIALGANLGGFPTLMVSIVNWFERNRSKAVAVSQMGYSFGGLSVPLVIYSLEIFGWRTTAFISGVIILLVGLPLAELVRHRPGPYGEAADGTIPDGKQQKRLAARTGQVNFTTRQAMASSAFWLISFGHAAALLVVSSVMVYLIPHLTDRLGYSLIQAGWVMAGLTAFQVIGQLNGGFLGDHMNKRLVCLVCMVSHAVGMMLLAHASNLWMIFGFTLLHGLAWGTRGPLMVALRADYFGAASFGTIMGFSSLIVMLGMAGGPLITGFMADIFGNHVNGFTLMAAASFLGSFCFLLATPPRYTGSREIS